MNKTKQIRTLLESLLNTKLEIIRSRKEKWYNRECREVSFWVRIKDDDILGIKELLKTNNIEFVSVNNFGIGGSYNSGNVGRPSLNVTYYI